MAGGFFVLQLNIVIAPDDEIEVFEVIMSGDMGFGVETALLENVMQFAEDSKPFDAHFSPDSRPGSSALGRRRGDEFFVEIMGREKNRDFFLGEEGFDVDTEKFFGDWLFEAAMRIF